MFLYNAIMKILPTYLRENFSYVVLSIIWLFSVFNPVFKKYDYGAEFPTVILFGVVIFLIAIFEFKQKREKPILEKIFLMIFLVSIGLSFVFSQTKNTGFSEVLAFFSVVILYLIFAYKKIDWIGKFLKIVIIGSVFAVILGYFFYFLREETRFFGPFFNILDHSNVWPNAFSLFLIMTWPIFILFFEKKGKLYTALLIGLILSGLFLTYSRGAMIVLGGQGVLLFIYFLKRIRFKTIILSILALGFCIFLFWEANYLRAFNHEVIDLKERISFENGDKLTSKQERIDFWLGAIELIKEKPLFGWGPFSFRQAYNPIQKTFLGNADHPHNIFLKIGAENGLIALGSFLAFLLTVLVTVLKRFSLLSKRNKDILFILSVSVLGAVAHNLIDYNFNFFANLLLLFIFLIFIRSLVIKKATKVARPYVGILLSFIIALISLYEGGLLFLDHIVYDKFFSDSSLFPRNTYLSIAEADIYDNYYEGALIALDKQISLNPLDSQAWYLKGVVYCEEKYENFDLNLCRENFEKALNLNPMNDFSYYRDYFRVLEKLNLNDEINKFIEKYLPLIELYFDYVRGNVHFTAYTQNVENVAEFIYIISPYLDQQKSSDLLAKRIKMLETAEAKREEKTY